MSTTHRPNTRTTDHTNLDRCLRHHVWMAACGDCRDAHRTDRGRRERPRAS